MTPNPKIIPALAVSESITRCKVALKLLEELQDQQGKQAEKQALAETILVSANRILTHIENT